jgi:hypothetical protein
MVKHLVMDEGIIHWYTVICCSFAIGCFFSATINLYVRHQLNQQFTSMYSTIRRMDVIRSLGIAIADLLGRLTVGILYHFYRLPPNSEFVLLAADVSHAAATSCWIWVVNRRIKMAFALSDCTLGVVLSTTLVAISQVMDAKAPLWAALINIPSVCAIWLAVWCVSLHLGCGTYYVEKEKEPDIESAPTFSSKTLSDGINL